MPHGGVLKASKLLMVLVLWSLPVLARAQATPAAAPTAADAAPAAAQQKTPGPAPAPAAAEGGPAAAQGAAEAANPSEYAGAQGCQACHADIYTGWEKSPNWKQTYKE